MARPRSRFDSYVRSISVVRDPSDGPPQYPFTIPSIRALDTLELDPKVTFFVGENGSGKSTLTEAIAIAMGFNAEGGSRNFNFATRRSESELHRSLRVARGVRRPKNGFFLRAESFYNMATQVEQLGVGNSYGPRALHEQSHGESFLALVQHRFSGDGFYVLDEPEAALSPQRQLAFLVSLHDLVQAGSQFVIATHSPILLAYPEATIYSLGDHGIAKVAYEETEHYSLTRDFLQDPKRYLRRLLGET